MLAPANDTAGNNGQVDLSPFYSQDMSDHLHGLDYFTDASSLDHLAGIASLMGPALPGATHVATASTPSSDSQTGMSHSGLSTSTPPSDPGMSVFYSAWPSTLPDVNMTRHL